MNGFFHLYDENGSFGTKKAFVDKSVPFDRQRELMSLQHSLMHPLIPQAHKIGGLLKNDRGALSASGDFVIRRGPHEPTKGPFRLTKAFSKMTRAGASVTKKIPIF